MPDGRNLNRLSGPVRTPGSSDGLSRAQAERAFRSLQDAEQRAPRRPRSVIVPTVDGLADSLRQKFCVRGPRRSYLEGCDSTQHVYISPRFGAKPASDVTTAHLEALTSAMLDDGLGAKTVRNLLTFSRTIFEDAPARGVVGENPVRRGILSRRRPRGDVNLGLKRSAGPWGGLTGDRGGVTGDRNKRAFREVRGPEEWRPTRVRRAKPLTVSLDP